MSPNSLAAIAGAAALAVVGAALPVAAQNPTPTGSSPRAHPRIEVTPRPQLYRRCTSWYVVQYRPSGRVLFPQKHCWWVRG